MSIFTKHIKSGWQGRCKPNAESLLYAEVQPVLAYLLAKIQINVELLLPLCLKLRLFRK